MKLSEDQKKQLEGAEKDAAEKLGKVLTDDQKKQVDDKPLGFGELPPPGKLMSAALQDRLKLTDDQKKQIAEIQKDADDKLDGLLKDDQKKQLKQMQDMAKGFPGGPPGGPPAAPRRVSGLPRHGCRWRRPVPRRVTPRLRRLEG